MSRGPDYYIGSVLTIIVIVCLIGLLFEILRALWERRK